MPFSLGPSVDDKGIIKAIHEAAREAAFMQIALTHFRDEFGELKVANIEAIGTKLTEVVARLLEGYKTN